jgi:hypothetical protein
MLLLRISEAPGSFIDSSTSVCIYTADESSLTHDSQTAILKDRTVLKENEKDMVSLNKP